ncbi:MAG: T9SS type A sorting domain-containing protein [Leeuwenhoekiella sp.]
MKRSVYSVQGICLSVIFVFCIQICAAQIVSSEADDGAPGTLRKEILDASPGANITFAAGVNHIKLNGEIILNKTIAITGNPDKIIIDAQGQDRIFLLQSCNLALENVTLTNGSADNGGAIMGLASSITLRRVSIMNCIANGASGSGGAVFLGLGSNLSGMNVIFEKNRANRAGGAIEDQSGSGTGVNLFNSGFSDNKAGVMPATPAPGNGGAIHVTGISNIHFTSCTFTNNSAASEGGAIWNDKGKLFLQVCTISENGANGNAADNGGGGIFNNGGELELNNTMITRNTATGSLGSGGGLFSVDGIIVMQNTQLNDNVANRAGAGVEIIDGNLTMNASKLIRNYFKTANPGNGAGLHVTGSASTTFANNFIYENKAASEGGGLWNNSGKMTINNCVVANNTASGNAADNGGAGIFNNGGDVEINGAQIRDNFSNGTLGSGGGLFSTDGTIIVNRTEFLRNKANRAGGGVELIDGTFSLQQGSLNKNGFGVPAPGNGGGLHVSGNANSTFINTTISNNIAPNEGGGLWNGSGTMTITQCFVTNNTASGNTTSAPLDINGGGGIYASSGGTVIVKDGTVLEYNFADGNGGSGGGILLAPLSTLQVQATDNNRVILANNGCNRAGGGIEDWSLNTTTTRLDYVDFIGNSAGSNILNSSFSPNPAPGNGGAFHVTGNGDVTLSNSTVRGNSAASEGGGFWNGLGKMIMNSCYFKDNNAKGDDADNGGGAIFNNGGDINITGLAIEDNNAMGDLGSGGAIFSTDGNITIKKTSLTRNRAHRAGGAIEVIDGDISIDESFLFKNNFITPALGNGAGLHISGSANSLITNTYIAQNKASKNGGGLYNGNGVMTIMNSSIETNSAEGSLVEIPFEVNGGGGIYAGSNGTLLLKTNTRISGNTAYGEAGSGGGILLAPNASLIIDVLPRIDGVKQVTIDRNHANRAGGGIEDWSLSGTITVLHGGDFAGNTVGLNENFNPSLGKGGAIHITGVGGMEIFECTFQSNQAANEGGAIWNGNGTITMKKSDFQQNSTNKYVMGRGGALFNLNGAIDLSQSDFRYNSAALEGGAIWNGSAILNIKLVKFLDNKVEGGNGVKGGAIFNAGGWANIVGAEFFNNKAIESIGKGSAGGAIANDRDGQLHVSESSFRFNQTDGPGGAIADFSTSASGSVKLDDVFVAQNFTQIGNGTGLYMGGSGTARIENSSFIYNETDFGRGSAIFNNSGAIEIMTTTVSRNKTNSAGPSIFNVNGNIELEAVTVAENFGGRTEGGLGGNGGTIKLSNTVVAVNSGGFGDLSPGPVYYSEGYNFVEDFQNNLAPLSTDIMSTQHAFINPRLETLPYSDGFYVMVPESPLINKGNPDDKFLDQIGNPVFGPRRDIGAIEAQFLPQAQSLASGNSILRQSVLYPNPARFGSATLTLPDGVSGKIVIEIFEMSSGRMMNRQEGTAGDNILEVSNFAAGTYLVKITSGETVQSEKLIISH